MGRVPIGHFTLGLGEMSNFTLGSCEFAEMLLPDRRYRVNHFHGFLAENAATEAFWWPFRWHFLSRPSFLAPQFGI